MCALRGSGGCSSDASFDRRSGVLTELQQRVRRLIAGLPESEAFALAGGAALVLSGIVRRHTNDLDYFAAHPQSVDQLLKAVRAALEDDGLRVAILSAGTTFARLRVTSDTDCTNVDLASDYRLMPAQPTEEGFVLAEAELAADKVLALAARAEARDYIDLQALAARFGVDELCELAVGKDPGFRIEHLCAALAYFNGIKPAAFGLGSADYVHLRVFVQKTRQRLCNDAETNREG